MRGCPKVISGDSSVGVGSGGLGPEEKFGDNDLTDGQLPINSWGSTVAYKVSSFCVEMDLKRGPDMIPKGPFVGDFE